MPYLTRPESRVQRTYFGRMFCRRARLAVWRCMRFFRRFRLRKRAKFSTCA